MERNMKGIATRQISELLSYQFFSRFIHCRIHQRIFFFFSIRVFFHGHWQLTGQQGKGGDHLIPLYNFHPLTNTQTFICNFAPWLSNMSNDCLICLMGKSVSSSPFFPWFPSTHGMLCKMYLNGGWWRVQISYCCLIISWRVSRSHLDIRNVVKRLLFIL